MREGRVDLWPSGLICPPMQANQIAFVLALVVVGMYSARCGGRWVGGLSKEG